MGGFELSFVSEDEAWVMFDGHTSTSVSFPPVTLALDAVVAEVILTDSSIREMIKDLIRTEFENKGWVRK